jgi:thioredoxin
LKKFFFVVTIVAVVVLASGCTYFKQDNQGTQTSQDQTSNLNWHSDMNSALDEAKKTRKPIMIDFYATWCSYCQQLDNETFQDPRVQEKLSQDYVRVKIDGDQNPDLVSKYNIFGYPTLVFLNSDGQEIKRQEGYLPADQLLNLL